MLSGARQPNFGAWVKQKITDAGIPATRLSAASGIVYPTLMRLLKGVSDGAVIRPYPDTIEDVSKALVELGVIEDVAEAYLAAGYQVPGYKVVKESDLHERSASGEMTYDLSPDSLRAAEAAEGMDPINREMFLKLGEALLKTSREGAVGRRDEGDPKE